MSMKTNKANEDRRPEPASRRRARLTRFDLTVPGQLDALLAAVAVDGIGEVSFMADLRKLCAADAGTTHVGVQARRSRDGRTQEASLRRQLADAVAILLRRKEGLRLVVVYLIEAVSGGLIWRRGVLDPVVADAKAGVITELWHWDNSRLGRMPPQQKEAYRDALEANGVMTLDLSNSDPRRRDEGVMFERLSKDLRSNRDLHDRARAAVSSARRAFVDRPDFRAGVVNYGFSLEVRNIDTGEVRIVKRGVAFRAAHYERTRRIAGDPVEVAAVLDMYRWYVGDDPAVGKLGLAKLASRLNDAGIRSPTGKLWIPRAVWLVLTNPAYAGTVAYNRRESGNYATAGPNGEPKEVVGQAKLRWRPEGEYLKRDGAHDALVPAELWLRVQAEVARRSRKGSSPTSGRPNQYSLRSPRRRLPTCFCDHCGLAMTMAGKPEDLRCTGFVQRGAAACQNYGFDQREVARLLWNAHAEDVASLLGTSDLRGRLEDHVRRILEEKSAPAAAPSTFDAGAARKRIAAIGTKISLLIEMLSPESAKYADAEIKRLGAEKQLLESKLKEEAKPAARAAPGDIDADVKAVMARLKSLSRPVDEIEPAAVRELLETFIEPGSLRVGFTPAPEIDPKGSGSGRKRSYVLDRVKVALLDPRSSMLVTTRWERSP